MISTIYEFYAELEDFKPKIWRRFQVSSDITVAEIGYAVMVMYEMEASHLFAIEHERPYLTPSGRLSKRTELICRYDIPDEDDEWKNLGGKDATKIRLSELNLESPSQLLVWYDFGDDWRVILKLEKVLNNEDLPNVELPQILEGKCFGIVEDCGGVYGLADLTEAFKTKEGKEYERFSEWLGVEDFDIKMFDIDDMNFRLKTIPQIYKKIYENRESPTEREIDLIEREYISNK